MMMGDWRDLVILDLSLKQLDRLVLRIRETGELSEKDRDELKQINDRLRAFHREVG